MTNPDQDNFNNYTDYNAMRAAIIKIAHETQVNKQSEFNDMLSDILRSSGYHGLAEQLKENADYDRSRNN